MFKALFILTNRICYENDSAERVKEIKEIEEEKNIFEIPRLMSLTFFFRVSLINLDRANDKRVSFDGKRLLSRHKRISLVFLLSFKFLLTD